MTPTIEYLRAQARWWRVKANAGERLEVDARRNIRALAHRAGRLSLGPTLEVDKDLLCKAVMRELIGLDEYDFAVEVGTDFLSHGLLVAAFEDCAGGRQLVH